MSDITHLTSSLPGVWLVTDDEALECMSRSPGNIDISFLSSPVVVVRQGMHTEAQRLLGDIKSGRIDLMDVVGPLCVWRMTPDRLELAIDAASLAAVYEYRHGSDFVLSNTMWAIPALAGIEPRLDSETMTLYACLGYFPDTRTPLVSVQRRLGGTLVMTHHQVGLLRSETRFDLPRHLLNCPESDEHIVLEEATALLIDSTTRLRELGKPLLLGLTAGRDSRAILAALVHEGVDFHAVTNMTVATDEVASETAHQHGVRQTSCSVAHRD